MIEQTRQEIVDAAQRIRNFLEDEAVTLALNALEERNYQEFLTSTPETRADAWAKGMVLRDFRSALAGIMDAGEAVKRQASKRT